jgi:hypothetical protein
MPRLTSLRCGNYVAFGQQVELAVRPLTLILGKNSSGKSALLRAIRLALRALRPDATGQHLPLEVDGLVFGTRFLDLVHGRFFTRAISLGLTMISQDQTYAYDAEIIARDSSGEGTWIKTLHTVSAGSPDTFIELDLAARHQPTYSDGVQHVFDGILPVKGYEDIRRAALAVEQRLTHLGPVRAAVPAALENEGHVGTLGYDGRGAPHILRRDRELSIDVDRWYRENLGARVLVSPQGDSFSMETASIDDADTGVVNFSRAGEGLQQVLPVITQQFAARRSGDSFLSLVEQPELHLHDAVHAPLADLFLDTARTRAGSVVVETHSEGILLRIRRRVAEGQFDPGDVAVYFVQDEPRPHVVKVTINELGELDAWPEGVFLEGYREVLAIERAIRSRNV